MSGNLSIEVKNLTKKFGNFTAVDSISFEVKKGEIFGFLGANGAGKTTAIKMLCGILKATSGEASVAGFDIFKQTEKLKKYIGYMSQRFSLYEDLSITENLRFYGGIYGLSSKIIKERSQDIIKKLNFADIAKRKVASLPLGWRQKLAFSLAMMHQPQIVFLDEPTGGVDPIVRRQFWNMIYEAANKGITIFVTTHYMDEAEYCDRVSIMVDGRIEALDTPNQLKQQFQSETMDEVFIKLARG